MGNLQIKNVPEELHRALSERAKAEGTTMSEYAQRVLRLDLSTPRPDEWVEIVPRLGSSDGIDSAALIAEVRDSGTAPAHTEPR